MNEQQSPRDELQFLVERDGVRFSGFKVEIEPEYIEAAVREIKRLRNELGEAKEKSSALGHLDSLLHFKESHPDIETVNLSHELERLVGDENTAITGVMVPFFPEHVALAIQKIKGLEHKLLETLRIFGQVDAERKEALAEIERIKKNVMREAKAKTITLELPSEQNGHCFFITAPWSESEERLAKELSAAAEMVTDLAKHIADSELEKLQAELDEARAKIAKMMPIVELHSIRNKENEETPNAERR